jgi:hypothetical protein
LHLLSLLFCDAKVEKLDGNAAFDKLRLTGAYLSVFTRVFCVGFSGCSNFPPSEEWLKAGVGCMD